MGERRQACTLWVCRLGRLAGVLLLTGCTGPDGSEIEQEMENWLGGDIPSDFEVVESSYTFAIGDDLTTVQIDYSPESYAAFLNAISPQHADMLRAGLQIDVTRELDEGGYDFFLLTLMDSREHILRIQYGNE